MTSDILTWKRSKNVRWIYKNLWYNINKDGNNPNDIYINRITNEFNEQEEMAELDNNNDNVEDDNAEDNSSN
ncbi:hypothetical protein RhiirA4_463826 [Rhizophagus irregularis]|uniref:Uncharacterized protein n=1 Tax=Rhizophagus irregularis TaxID=588596 RepID=A0A2I1GNR0_9GLOM|nr:hypothetical protein RhiirA4_463826 [Rhizophagus irregularis]